MRSESTELVPRYAWLAPLLAGARVLELGAVDAAGGATAVLLHDRGAASVVSLGSGAAVERARGEHGGPGLTFRSCGPGQLQEASFDLALVHDVEQVLARGAVTQLIRLLAPGGHLVVAIPAAGPSLLPGDAPSSRYAAALAALRPAFPSIEVATQQALLGWVVSPAAGTPQGLAVDDGFAKGESPAFHLLVCGSTASGLADQVLVPLPASPLLARWEAHRAGGALEEERARIEELVQELRHARERIAERESWIEGLRHEVDQLHRQGEEREAERQAAQVKLTRLEREHAAANDSLRRVREQLVVRTRELDGARRAVDARTQDLRLAEEELEKVRQAAQAVGRERAALQEENAGLRERLAATSGVASVEQEQARLQAEVEALRNNPPDLAAAGSRQEEDPSRRLRQLEEQAEAAARRARELEDRLRAAEQRADAADTARAESVAAARRWQLEAETARREAAGVAAGMADRDTLREERDRALATAAEEAGRRVAARSQLQRETERAERAEAQLALLRRELDRHQPNDTSASQPS